MLRGHIHRDGVAVADHRVDQPLLQAPLPHDLLLLDAVLLRVPLKIQVVQQANQPPEIGFLAVAQLLGKVAHDALHDLGVLQMKGVLIVFRQQLPGFLSCHIPSFLSIPSNRLFKQNTY